MLRKTPTALLILLFSAAVAIGLQFLNFYTLDALFMDLRQQFTPNPRSSGRFVTVTMNIEDRLHLGESFPSDVFRKLLENISKSGPRAIVIELTPFRVSGKADPKEYRKIFDEIPNVYLYSAWGDVGYDDIAYFYRDPLFKDFPHHIYGSSSADLENFAQDRKKRRSILAYKGDLDETPKSLNRELDFKISLEKFPYAFDMLWSKQIFLKYRSIGFYGNIPWRDVLEDKPYDFKNKFVIVTSDETYSRGHPSIFRQFKYGWAATSHIMSYGEHLANVWDDLLIQEYIKLPPLWINVIWSSIVFASFLLAVFFLPPIRVAILSVPFLAAVFFIGWASYLATDFLLDLSRSTVGLLLLQYISLPVLFTKLIRDRDRQVSAERAKSELAIFQSRALAKSARADLGLKIALQVAHDLRSPLMAIKIVNDNAKNTLSEDTTKLLGNAVGRLEDMSKDLLERYRTGAVFTQKERVKVDVMLVLNDLVDTFRNTYPSIEIHFSRTGQPIICKLTKSEFERAISNLTVNAIDALRDSNTRNPKISIDVKLLDSVAHILISDNGPGIPFEIKDKLFLPGVTKSKEGGTGLGLNQVQTAFTSIGGKVSLMDSKSGTQFEIQIPILPFDKIISTFGVLVVADDSQEILESISSRAKKNNVTCETFWSPTDCIKRIEEFGKSKKTFTLISDLIFQGHDETGFDILGAGKSAQAHGSYLYTSLSENEEVAAMASSMGAIVISKMLHLDFRNT